MKLSALVISLSCLLPFSAYSQLGKIIRPATATASVMDPNGDGYITQTQQSCQSYCNSLTDPIKKANCLAQCPTCTTQCSFSTDGYYVDEFEINMFPIPQLGSGDVTNDNIGNSCGITDLIPDIKGQSVYAVHQTGPNQDNLIFRFRVGDDNPSVESWTILLDTDGLYGANDPNSTPDNPGFEIDITLIKRNNAGVYVYDIDGIDNCPSPLLSYPIDSHFQISIADLVTCGDPDYFYDFYVPFDQISSAFQISTATGLRFVAVTNVSATCAMAGQIADVSGVDNNDPAYSGCVTCAFEDLVSNQCATPLSDLCPTCPGFQKDKVYAPSIKQPLWAGQTTVSGKTNVLDVEKNIFVLVEVYTFNGTSSNGVIINPSWQASPRISIGATANGANWGVDLTQATINPGPLQSFDKIKAIAKISSTNKR